VPDAPHAAAHPAAAPTSARQLALAGGALARALLALLLPRHCVACGAALPSRSGEESAVVCGRCWASLLPLPYPRCARCGHPRRFRPGPARLRAHAARCEWCALLPPYVRAARSVCWIPGGEATAIVHALKYDGWRAVAAGMGQRMARTDWPEDVAAERAGLVPVPLAPARERERGYNQSLLLAEALGAAWRLPVLADVLCRARSTASQTRLTPGERLRNVAGAFHAPAATRDRLSGAHLVLVDDVVTTAATLNACAAALVAGGARILSYVTFARAPAAGDAR